MKNKDLPFRRRFHKLNDEKNEKFQNTPNADYFKKKELLARIKILLDYKPIFKNKIEELIFTFNECDFEPTIQKLKKECIDLFNDYILHPKAKLKYNNNEVNQALAELENKVGKYISEISKIMDIKIQNLKANIVVLLHHTNHFLFDTEAKMENGYVKNEVDKDKELKYDDIAEPLIKALGGIGAGLGAIIGIGLGVGAAESVGAGFLFGAYLGTAGIGIGAIFGLVGFGIYKIYKATHKEEDLVELVQKGKNTFDYNVNNYYNTLKYQLEEYKNKVILEVNSIIEKKVFELKKELDALENPPNNYDNNKNDHPKRKFNFNN